MQASSFQTNQSSRASVNTLIEPTTEDIYEHSCLDRKIDRYDLLLLAKRVGKEWGFTPRMLQLLEYYLAYTTASDWEEGSRPIVFQSLARTAMDLGVGERQIQKLERRLFEVGAITWNDSGNHKRFGRRDPITGRLVFAYGVDLTPFAYLEGALRDKLQEKLLYAEAWRSTKRDISALRRKIRAALSCGQEEGADGRDLGCYELAYSQIAVELRSHIDLARLRRLEAQHRKLYRELRAANGSARDHRLILSATTSPVAENTSKGTCRRGPEFAHTEQTTPDKKIGGGAIDWTNERASATRLKAIGKMKPQQIADVAAETLRAHLVVTGKVVKWSDLVDAAYRRRHELQISQASWADACHHVGRRGAAIALILTDHATHRSERPARRPPAYFRALVRAFGHSAPDFGNRGRGYGRPRTSRS